MPRLPSAVLFLVALGPRRARGGLAGVAGTARDGTSRERRACLCGGRRPRE